jgi:hypothetical protein
MRRSLMIMVVAAAAGVACGTSAANAATTGAAHSGPALAVSGTWGSTEVVPGTAVLNTQGDAAVASVSCPSTGNCAVGGFYETLINGHNHTRPFVDSQTNGRWHIARQVPGITALSGVGNYAAVTSLSCASAGNCVAGGGYSVGLHGETGQAWLASETDGTWSAAQEVTGFADSSILSVSCGAPGDCTAGGDYAASNPGPMEAFVISETDGTWGTPEEVPGTATLNTGGAAEIFSVSCPSAGTCGADGYYTGSGTVDHQAFVVNETGGTWGTAQQVPGLATLNAGGNARLESMSCSSAGNCSAGGEYSPGSGLDAFVVSETDGTWGTAQQVTGLTTGASTEISAVSCATAGNCSAGGQYILDGLDQPFVVNQKHGTWGKAQEVPGLGTLDAGGFAGVTAVSCGAAGDCSATGAYNVDGTSAEQAFVVSEAGGTWGTAQNAPGTSDDSSSLGSVSCASATHCVAGGNSADSSGNQQAIVASRT